MSLRRQTRQAALLTVIQEVGGQTELAAMIGTPKTHISAMASGKRGVGDELAARIERKTGKPAGWMDAQHWTLDQHAAAGPVTGVVVSPLAQQLSDPQPSMAPPVVPMESVRMGDVKEHFALVIEDDALDPSYPRGTIAEFRRDRPPIAGKPVLLRDRDGNVFIRRFEVRTPTHWLATAEKPGYQPLDSVRDGLEILATMTGHRW